MKKKLRFIFAFAFILITVIISVIPLSAAQRLSDFDTLKTPIMKGTPDMDGEKDEMYIYSLEFDRPYLYHYAEDSGNLQPGSFTEEGFGVTMKATGNVLWDENNIYIFLEVTDDEMYGSNDASLSYWTQGSGVIVMYLPGDAGGDNVNYRKLRVAYSADTYNASPSPNDGEYPDDCVYIYKKTSTGWNLEIQIKLGSPVKQDEDFQFALQVCSVSADKNMGFAHVNDGFAQITFPFKLGGDVVIPIAEVVFVPETDTSKVIEAETVSTAQPADNHVAPQTGDGIIFAAALAVICVAVLLHKKAKLF